MRFARSLPFAFAVCLAVTGTAQVSWTVEAPLNVPPVRALHGLEEVLLARELMLFGGETSSGSGYLRDTWTWDGTDWTLQASPSSPVGRGAHGMAYDLLRNRVVLFSGWNGFNYVLDTWEWDPTNRTWTQKSSPVFPPRRDWPGMAMDFNLREVLMFGGHDWQKTPDSFDDTWSWNGTRWQQHTPAVNPGPRHGHAMVWDANLGAVLLFGGSLIGQGLQNDTWTWDGVSWTQRSPVNQPSARAFHSMTWDPRRRRAVLFGGDLGGGVVANDVWEWDGVDWSQRMPLGSPPTPRAHADMAYDSTRGEVVLFGGSLSSGRTASANDTLSYAPTTPATSSSFGGSCPGSAGTPSLVCGVLAWVGSVYDLTLVSAPPLGQGLILIGLSNTMTSGGIPLPFSLAGVGIPCNLYVDPAFLAALPIGAGGSAQLTVGLPPDPSMVGVPVFSQGGALDPGAPGGLTLTNGCRHLLGGL